ncbi:MAG TPA: polyphosphate kinase 1, partial [Leptospiraceae bacterium]|nr:polyphosphate kinase 1 [Leptospiraceae bacterium]
QISIDNPEIFFERELSWLDFNFRVLEEAGDPRNPLLERLKFLSITESNLDEFFMVRVAGVRDSYQNSDPEKRLTGLSYGELLQQISEKTALFVKEQYRILEEMLIPELKKNKIRLTEASELQKEDIEFLNSYYKEGVSGILTPLSIDPSHPFPHILNKSLNLAISLSENENQNGKTQFAIVQVPSVLPRFVELPRITEDRRFFPLEKIIELHLSDLFYGMTVREIHAFRIVRDSDISIREDAHLGEGDLLSSVKKELKNRSWGEAVRLDISRNAPSYIKNTLRDLLDLKDYEVYECNNILNLTDLVYFYGLSHTNHLKFKNIHPRKLLDAQSLDKVFQGIRKSDIIFHHPYDSFQAVEDMLKFASMDPKVLGIKMTLYRTSGDSPIIQYLQQAAENGKQVTVLVELKARFDEERNIMWAQRLEDSGVHVVYGVMGLKIHCKLLLVVRRESERLRKYVHLSTGNYNSSTAKYYTDISLLTQHEEITEDVSTLFNVLTSFAKMPKFTRLSVAPNYLRDDLIAYIRNEAERAAKGKEAYIFLKMNSLVDPDVILELYHASCAGVKIDLVVRGICCLRPGVAGVSENITVRSIIGRFLEHSRIYLFHNSGEKSLFLASADCMPRNFYKRIEVMFPILDKGNRDRILKIVDMILKDDVKARYLSSDGTYSKKKDSENLIDSQVELAKV